MQNPTHYIHIYTLYICIYIYFLTYRFEIYIKFTETLVKLGSTALRRMRGYKKCDSFRTIHLFSFCSEKIKNQIV